VLQFNALQNPSSIDLSELNKGIYLLKAPYKGKTFIQKLIKF